MTASDNMVEACGAIHLHTVFSDGSVDYPTLWRTARSVGLDFVMVTDHMTLTGREQGFGGLHEGVLVVVGYEHHGTNGKNHYLVFGTPHTVPPELSPQGYVDAVRRDGGMGFIAHPCEKRRYFRRLPAYPWTAWDVEGFDGFEIWNQMSDWVERIRSWFSIVRFMYPRRFLTGPPPSLVRRWDALNRTRPVAGLGGVDAHTRVLHIGPLRYTVFPLKVELKGIRTHLFVPRPLSEGPAAEAEAVLLDALRRGRGFVSNYRRGDARGARMLYESPDGARWQPGAWDECVPGGGQLSADLPFRARIRLMCNGVVVGEALGRRLACTATTSGVYRFEASRGGRAWVYSNPFRIGLPAGGTEWANPPPPA